MKTLIICCSLNPQSRSSILAQHALAHLKSAGADAERIDLADLDLPLCDGAAVCDNKRVQRLEATITRARAVLLAAPVYNYSVNAAAKNLIELTGRAWDEKIVGFLCAAGGHGSYMSVMGLANSLMLDFRCLIIPRFIYAAGDAFDDGGLADENIKGRIKDLCHETLRLAAALNAAPANR